MEAGQLRPFGRIQRGEHPAQRRHATALHLSRGPSPGRGEEYGHGATVLPGSAPDEAGCGEAIDEANRRGVRKPERLAHRVNRGAVQEGLESGERGRPRPAVRGGRTRSGLEALGDRYRERAEEVGVASGRVALTAIFG